MIKQFFRQAWTMMKQHKFFTGIYLTGTAVSITLAMTLFIIFYIKLGNISPEEKRNRMIIIKHATYEKEENNNHVSSNTGVSRQIIEQIKSDAKNLNCMCYCISRDIHHPMNINVAGKDFGKYDNAALTDSGWWRVFNYKFLAGRGYTEQEEQQDVAVLSHSYAMKLFADTAIVGKTINIRNTPYHIIGVVEDVPQFMKESASNLWLPVHSSQADKYKEGYMLGCHTLYMTAPTVGTRETLKKEVEDIVKRMTHNLPENEKYEASVWEHWRLALMSHDEENFFAAISRYFYILLAFLFIPALNLSGIIISRMKGRMPEVGVRKAYGATNSEIITQVLWENMLLTLIGAALGLITSYIVVYTCSSWIITFFDFYIPNEPNAHDINTEMLLNPAVIICTLLLTLLLNIVSALVPTMLALKKNIIESLYQRR